MEHWKGKSQEKKEKINYLMSNTERGEELNRCRRAANIDGKGRKGKKEPKVACGSK